MDSLAFAAAALAVVAVDGFGRFTRPHCLAASRRKVMGAALSLARSNRRAEDPFCARSGTVWPACRREQMWRACSAAATISVDTDRLAAGQYEATELRFVSHGPMATLVQFPLTLAAGRTRSALAGRTARASTCKPSDPLPCVVCNRPELAQCFDRCAGTSRSLLSTDWQESPHTTSVGVSCAPTPTIKRSAQSLLRLNCLLRSRRSLRLFLMLGIW